MTKEEYELELMRAQDRAVAERIREQAFTSTAYYPYGMGETQRPMKMANARLIEPKQLE